MTRRQRSRKAWTKWRRLVCEQARSGESVAAFCRQRGVCAPQFFAWKKRLRQAETAQQPQGGIGGEAAKFVEVKVTGAAPEPDVPGGAAVEVRLSNGRSLLVGPGFDAQHVRALLAVVEKGA